MNKQSKLSPGKLLLQIFQGALIGLGAVLPGISGGVLSVIFGIYKPIMELLANPFGKFKTHVPKLIPYVFGAAIGFLGIANLLSYVLEKGKTTGIHVETCATVTMGMQGKEMVPMELLFEKGAVGFTDDGVPILDETLVREAMLMVKKLNVPISFHEENPAYIKNNGVNEGKASAYYGIGGADRQAEIDLVGRDLEIALETGACIDVQHISTKEAVELVRQAKKRGGDIHAEATPHHFTLTEDAVIQYGTLAKMNPPLREEADRMAVIEGLKDGTIDLIATDHAPHSKEEKDKPITEAPSGILGLETALGLSITQLVDAGHLTMMELLEKLTCNPANMYHLDAGYLAENGPADIVLFDVNKQWTVKEYASKSNNCPFTGWTLKGEVQYTICSGKVVYEAKG